MGHVKDKKVEDEDDLIVEDMMKQDTACNAEDKPCQSMQDKCQRILIKSGRTEWF